MNRLYDRLYDNIACEHQVAVAFSGGVDSTLLLKVALDALGASRVYPIMVSSDLVQTSAVKRAVNVTEFLGVSLQVINVNPLENNEIVQNDPDRCFFCKRMLFHALVDSALRRGFPNVLEGSNLSDLGDYRPGLLALQNFGEVKSPYLECQMTKNDIRSLAKYLDLPNWDLPSESCLAARIPYGTRITANNLSQVARAEALLQDLGIKQLRVRYHGDLARIEIAREEIGKVLNFEMLQIISEKVKSCGFTYTALDMDGYRTGSVNETIYLDNRDNI